MPSSSVHYKYYKWLASIILVLSPVIALALGVYLGERAKYPLQVLGWMVIFVFIARWIDPDLDQLNFTSGDNRMMKELPGIGILFSIWWTFYAMIVLYLAKFAGMDRGWLGGHGSVFSHSIRLGTIGRMIWFNFPIGYSFCVVYNWQPYYVAFIMNEPMVVVTYLLGQFIAWVMMDGLHIVLDNNWKGDEYDRSARRDRTGSRPRSSRGSTRGRPKTSRR